MVARWGRATRDDRSRCYVRAHKGSEVESGRTELLSRSDASFMKNQKSRLRVYKGPLTKRITVLRPNNPKTPGKLCYKRFELYRPGMAVAEYYLACEQIGEKPRRYKLDIEWDLDHGFIRLE